MQTKPTANNGTTERTTSAVTCMFAALIVCGFALTTGFSADPATPEKLLTEGEMGQIAQTVWRIVQKEPQFATLPAAERAALTKEAKPLAEQIERMSAPELARLQGMLSRMSERDAFVAQLHAQRIAKGLDPVTSLPLTKAAPPATPATPATPAPPAPPPATGSTNPFDYIQQAADQRAQPAAQAPGLTYGERLSLLAVGAVLSRLLEGSRAPNAPKSGNYGVDPELQNRANAAIIRNDRTLDRPSDGPLLNGYNRLKRAE